ncbi:hypothetical protein AVEN_63120-1 [Araneus ventricosus]|uniref:Reverse transcriptase domain-containing protein n=1 Tax=Araneus ventricosus TaxID=182803 RepID=A0A4Y2T8A7_ARAVE|nr:hypothetical protein AVEN_63120-1 [Araneus ventricosus]
MPIHEIQRGFVPCDGIAENCLLFARILKNGNTVTDETAIVLLEFARAFDSVGHVHMFAALERLGGAPHTNGSSGFFTVLAPPDSKREKVSRNQNALQGVLCRATRLVRSCSKLPWSS